MFVVRSGGVSRKFVNRAAELHELEAAARQGSLLVVFGRRRVGKTRLLRQWLDGRDGLYGQAIEGPRALQLQQIFADLKPRLETQLEPKTWPELFRGPLAAKASLGPVPR